MDKTTRPTHIRRLVLVRSSASDTAAVRRLMLARSGDALLPPARPSAPSAAVRAP